MGDLALGVLAVGASLDEAFDRVVYASDLDIPDLRGWLFKHDVVEVCTDEMEPITARNLIRPLDPEAVKGFDDLAFSDSDDVRNGLADVPLILEDLLGQIEELRATDGDVDVIADLLAQVELLHGR